MFDRSRVFWRGCVRAWSSGQVLKRMPLLLSIRMR
jgi:hypothetical protein